jgi:hypothetical protein
MTAQPITHDPAGDPFEVTFIPSPAEAYARAFACVGVPMPASLTVRLPMPFSAAPDAALHHLLAQLDEREAVLGIVMDRLRRLPAAAEEPVLYGPLLEAGLESTTSIRECLLLELSWRAARASEQHQPGEGR